MTSSTLDLNHPLRVSPLLDWEIQSNSVNTDTEGGIESVRIKLDEFRENVRANNAFSVTISMDLYSNKSWAKTNHNAGCI